jgi:hypothetical protein
MQKALTSNDNQQPDRNERRSRDPGLRSLSSHVRFLFHFFRRVAMATHKQSNTGRTLAVIGGGALLVWLLWRGRGKGKGSGGNGDHTSAPVIVEVWLRSDDSIELDGVSSDLATVVARARAAGKARVHVTGAARQGWFEKVVDTLRGAGVDVWVLG